MENRKFKFYLKKLSIDEIEQYLILNDDYFFIKLSERVDIFEYSKKLNENALHFTFYEGDKLVGFSPCYFNKEVMSTAYISALIIRYDYSGFGLQRKLLEVIKKYAQKNNFNQILVSFHCKNTKSIKFYEKNEFIRFDQNQKTGICAYKYVLDNKKPL